MCVCTADARQRSITDIKALILKLIVNITFFFPEKIKCDFLILFRSKYTFYFRSFPMSL